MDYLSCPTLGWLSKNRKIKKLFGLYGDLLVYEIKRIRETLQSLFKPNVNFLRYNSDTDNSQNTDIFNDSKNDVIINVSLPIGDCIAKADILQRDGEAWKLYEVNIGIKHKTKYINALAFNAMLFEKASIKISEIFTVHINRAYRLGMPAAKMFSFTNCAKKVQEKMPQYIDNIEAALKELSSQEMPPASIKRNCKNCPAFDICIGKDLSQSLIFDMPKLSSIAAQELMDKGIRYINDIPDDFELTPMQKIAKNCVKTNTIYVSDNLKNLLANIKPPYYYLDFESITNVIPIYRNFAPHSQILTQFSIDKCFDIDKVEAHYEYIADPARNCQEVIAQKLIEYFESEGSIITYANFEKIAIKRLAALYPQYKQKLIEITDRIVDFEE
ncbi:MAG: DUF2779 domain-containing protein, partial [Elusimicrobiota bacterium]|nr:DUF2779 domain-containing protein [Elusimicrobiota bacterium]